MGKASEIWKEIKPKIGEMLAAVNDIETRAEKTQEEAYQRGLNDAWDAARKIVLDKEDGGLDTATYRETFGYGKGFGAVLKAFTASEAIEKIRKHEQRRRGKRMGDFNAIH